jgi:hypothetical protein
VVCLVRGVLDGSVDEAAGGVLLMCSLVIPALNTLVSPALSRLKQVCLDAMELLLLLANSKARTILPLRGGRCSTAAILY